MSYTCEDCKKQCWERSRKYPCREFALGELPASEARRVKRERSKRTRANTKARTEAENGLNKESGNKAV